MTSQLAENYETSVKIISYNFNNNKDRYIEGKHYYCLIGDEKREFCNRLEIQDGCKATKLYLWTQKGALLHAKSLNTDKAWEVYDYLVDSYFNKREIYIDNKTLALTRIITADTELEQAIAIKEYTKIVEKPLLETIEVQKPKVALADKRLNKKGCISITDATEMFGFKKRQLTGWAKENGYLHKKLTEVNANGKQYFKVYSSDNVHNQIGILDDGIQLIRENENAIHDFKIKRESKKNKIEETDWRKEF